MSDDAKEIRLESLVGRRVFDADGAELGRLEEVIAESEEGELLVRGFLVGRHAMMTRLGGGRLTHALARLLTRDRGYEGLMVRWDAMDLSDPERPRCTLTSAEVKRRTQERERTAGGVISGR